METVNRSNNIPSSTVIWQSRARGIQITPLNKWQIYISCGQKLFSYFYIIHLYSSNIQIKTMWQVALQYNIANWERKRSNEYSQSTEHFDASFTCLWFFLLPNHRVIKAVHQIKEKIGKTSQLSWKINCFFHIGQCYQLGAVKSIEYLEPPKTSTCWTQQLFQWTRRWTCLRTDSQKRFYL
jgi:hypothetical protein